MCFYLPVISKRNLSNFYAFKQIKQCMTWRCTMFCIKSRMQFSSLELVFSSVKRKEPTLGMEFCGSFRPLFRNWRASFGICAENRRASFRICTENRRASFGICTENRRASFRICTENRRASFGICTENWNWRATFGICCRKSY